MYEHCVLDNKKFVQASTAECIGVRRYKHFLQFRAIIITFPRTCLMLYE